MFGPHPDDIEIGIGGTVAKHARLGHRVGLCDLTAGEMGSNGTVEERLAEAEAARAVLGASWRINLRLPDRAIGSSPDHLRAVAGLVRCARPRAVAMPYWSDRHPDHVRASELLTEAVFSAGLRRFDAGGEAWKPDAVFYYFINDHVRALVRRRRERRLRDEAARAGLPRDAVRARRRRTRWPRGSRRAAFSSSSRAATRSSARRRSVAFAEGFVTRQTLVRAHLLDG